MDVLGKTCQNREQTLVDMVSSVSSVELRFSTYQAHSMVLSTRLVLTNSVSISTITGRCLGAKQYGLAVVGKLQVIETPPGWTHNL